MFCGSVDDLVLEDVDDPGARAQNLRAMGDCLLFEGYSGNSDGVGRS
jgi:hypothetical protein